MTIQDETLREAQWVWAAGLFEGEGCITCTTDSRKDRPKYYLPRLALTSTDEDIIRRFHEAVGGAGSVRGPVKPKNAPDHWKVSWQWCATGKHAAAVMERLLPWLGQRRQARWEEVLQLSAKNVSRPKPPRLCTVEGCDGRHYARGMCEHHYGQWHHQQGGRVGSDLRFNAERRKLQSEVV